MNNIHLKGDATIAPFMENIITEVARKHPDWIIASSATEEARKFTVYHKNDMTNPLGHIKEEAKYVRGDRRKIFLVENWRISEMRERGYGVQTSKPKEALKAVEKYFYPLTTQEHIDSAFQQAQHLVSSASMNASNSLSASIRKLHPPMMTFARKNWDEFVHTLDEATKGEALNLLKHQQLSNEAKKLYTEVESKKCLTVFLSDGKYTVQQGEVLQDYESDTLPEHIKTKVGLLKLVEEKEVIPEVGVRVGNLYVVRP
jgi:hypothetical protein